MQPGPDILPAGRMPATALCAAMRAAFADYAVPMQPAQAAFDDMMRQRGLDPAASRVALDGDAIVAIWLVARRGSESYLVASGTVPSHRGTGLARALAHSSIEALRTAGARRVSTEVMDGNAPAQALYRSLGMEEVRRLACFAWPEGAGAGPEAARVRRWSDLAVDAGRFADWPPSWQNDDASLLAIEDRLTGLSVEEDGTPVGVAAVLANGTLGRIAVRPDRRRRGIGTALVRAARARGAASGLRLVNADAADAGFAAFVAATGARPTVGQLELAMDLAPA